jgi:hypothetical protein
VANFTIGVVAHVDRQPQIDYLSRVAHPDVIIPDDGSAGVSANHIAVLTSLYQIGRRTGQPWLVVLEDDAIICDRLHEQLNQLLDIAPSLLVSLYNGTGYPMQYQRQFAKMAGDRELNFILHRHMRHAVGYAVHSSLLTQYRFIDHLAEQARKGWPPDDAMSHWCRRYDQMVAYTNPSLVDHEDGPSVIRQRKGVAGPIVGARRYPRRAHWFGDRDFWSNRKVDII